MNGTRPAMRWLVDEWQWPYASLFTGLALLILAPAWFLAAGSALGCVYLQLPLYMLHQWEEHADDRFRRYVNQHIAGGREALTPLATFWINALGVWATAIIALNLAACVQLSLGLIGVYLLLVNGLAHIGPAVRNRAYNPGLWTALLLFLPVGGWSCYVISTASGAGWPAHAIGVGAALAVHAAIILHVIRRIRAL